MEESRAWAWWRGNALERVQEVEQCQKEGRSKIKPLTSNKACNDNVHLGINSTPQYATEDPKTTAIISSLCVLHFNNYLVGGPFAAIYACNMVYSYKWKELEVSAYRWQNNMVHNQAHATSGYKEEGKGRQDMVEAPQTIESVIIQNNSD
ncbi:hypothetical protein EDD85DRAFT_789884 [Armillaria nabsnona]|nr:hypothetical protein EDD85DRAFT_789884 [Armillaria nabsnona]